MALSRTRRLRPVRPLTTYFFSVELLREDDGRWSAWVPELPGCATWGTTREEAVRHIREAAELYVQAMVEQRDKLPARVRSSRDLAIAVTV